MSFTRHVRSNLLYQFQVSCFRNSKPDNLKLLSLLWPLRSVLRASLHAVGNTHGVQRSTDHVIAHAWQIFHAASADQHNRVLLQVVADSGDIRGDFNAVREPHTRHFTESRIRLLRGLRVHARANAALLRASLQCRACRLVTRPLPALSHQLIERRHSRHSLAAHQYWLAASNPQSRSASVGMTGVMPTITSHRAGSHLQRTRDSGFPLRLTLPTVAPGQTPGALRFVSLALHILPHKGERHRRYVSARNVFELHCRSKTRFL